MYQIGDRVVYGIHGVCRVMEKEERVVDRKTVKYLILEPMDQPGSRYMIPIHNALAMSKVKPMLTNEELTSLLESQEVSEDSWIRDENQRKQAYRELISCGDRVRLMQMVRTLYKHRSEQLTAKRKVHICDDNFLRDAEKLLSSEIAVVTGVGVEEARQFLRSKLKADTNA